VVEDLRGNYPKINHDIFERIVSDVLGMGVGVLAAELGQSKEVQDGIKELIASMA